ncbi:methyltransferase domain-containing protein [Candidatus Woesearchaeota archaeon]|jgi:SAM-dependent methyltransferase|nr:methyltransferase domain-containing protein [Candidatus Woesearchaeota archaeon]MBT5397237.1 methyltransferase domain-containing protein [Candidatus Woesearchaeota archaeon]MBT5924304.1 methyltransferase domain-containing protein [Candidatus Woesearchaeota archaeon]MBT6367217.1 methyltransferase domain-containing protein [Candidatus Woesearchaeota archaeon]MBT7762637.1 methyltransferase domain-containing protein [Candidatus Woesearchaeota archaeon]
MSQSEEFWKTRSEKYNNLNWVTDDSYLNAIIEAGNFTKDDKILDVGTGTGVIAHTVAPLAKEIIGVDISQDMLQHSNWKDNKYFLRRDIRDRIFHEGVFDKVTARMVFHHIIEDTQKAMDECYHVLRPGGKMILAEGVPPTKELKDAYEEIFKLKEERIVFLEEDLVQMFEKAGFKDVNVITHLQKGFSVTNWIENAGGLSDDVKKKILDLHINGTDEFKRIYNLRIVDNECLIDTKSLIVVGTK